MSSQVKERSILDLVADFERLSIPCITDALHRLGIGRNKAMMHGMLPNIRGIKVAGNAVTLKYLPTREVLAGTDEDKKIRNNALLEADAGSILVVDGCPGASEGMSISLMGSNVVARAKKRGFKAIVLDGGYRDEAEVAEMKFPVYATQSTSYCRWGDWVKPVAYDVPVQCGGVLVNPGDIVLCDDDGVVVVPREKAEEILALAEEEANIEKLKKLERDNSEK